MAGKVRNLTAWVQTERVDLKEVASTLYTFGAYGSGEELYEYLTTNLNWSDWKTSRFMNNLIELERSL